MKRSVDRILTTHTGSLPRPKELIDTITQRAEGQITDQAAYYAAMRPAVVNVVRRQKETGVDIVSDGETSRPAYAFILDRLTGFGGDSNPPGAADLEDFEGMLERQGRYVGRVQTSRPACIGPVTMKAPDDIKSDIDNFKAALSEVQPHDNFMTAPGPGIIALFQENQYYPDHESYIFAVADAMKSDYRAIVGAGLNLQVDCPDLALARHRDFAHQPVEAFRDYVRINVRALNHALDGLPVEQLRMHICWGNYEGPHHRDVGFGEIADLIWEARPSAVSVEAANPRHAHEWSMFENAKLPEGKVLIPGVVESCSNYIEHPELIAQRLERYAKLIGRENVIAGGDCGFGTGAKSDRVQSEIAWAKLAAMAEGAKLASQRLWK